MSTQQGRKLEFLGMDITFHPYGYLRDTIAMFPDEILGPDQFST